MRKLTVACVLLAGSGCDKEGPNATRAQEHAAAYCDWVFSCNCSVFEYSDRGECLLVEQGLSEVYFDAGDYAGRTFDADCYAEELEFINDLSCDPQEAYGGTEECSVCKMYFGPVGEGEACDEAAVWDDCAKGLYCRDGLCVNPCPDLEEGDRCIDEHTVLPCPAGLECSFVTETCEKLAGLGDPCETASCGEGVCDYIDTMTCVEGAGEGEPCVPDCAEGLWCDFTDPANNGECKAPLPGGSDCSAGQLCESFCDGEVCVAQPEASCYE